MSQSLQTIRSVEALRKQVSEWRANGNSVGLVPTMGALHEGHLSLVELAKAEADKVVVSIFVNPTQFGPDEDFEEYPRDDAADLQKLGAAGVDVTFVPPISEMYPEGFATTIHVAGMTKILCGAHRETHFDGVALIVTKLLLQCLPDLAIFGEKDYQQLQVIRRFVSDLNIPVRILGGPIIRESDDLALSSRNRYLTPEERKTAARFPAILRSTAYAISQGAPIEQSLSAACKEILGSGFDSVDYVELRNASDLSAATDLGAPARLFGAVRIGATRLIDNWPVATPETSEQP